MVAQLLADNEFQELRMETSILANHFPDHLFTLCYEGDAACIFSRICT
jgi:hypothetical protein